MHYNLAYTYDKLGKEKKAIAEYEKVSPPTKEVLGILAPFLSERKKMCGGDQVLQKNSTTGTEKSRVLR